MDHAATQAVCNINDVFGTDAKCSGDLKGFAKEMEVLTIGFEMEKKLTDRLNVTIEFRIYQYGTRLWDMFDKCFAFKEKNWSQISFNSKQTMDINKLCEDR